MIEAVIFDLDGTLVQTEILKAVSYAKASVELSPVLQEKDVLSAFSEVVGRSRQEVASYLIHRFNLEGILKEKMSEFEVTTLWQAFIQIRLKKYKVMLEDISLLQKFVCPYNMALLKQVKSQGFSTGLATMSHCEQVRQVLNHLKINRSFNFIATREDVEFGKPNPEIYLLVAANLNRQPESCLVIEDSVAGIQAAIAAGMACIAVTSEFTRKLVHESGIIEKRWIVDNPERLASVAEQRIAEFK